MSHTKRELYIINTSDEVNNVIMGHADFAKEAGFEPIFVFPWRNNSRQIGDYGAFKTIQLNFTFSNSSHFLYCLSILKLIFFTTKALLFRRDVKYILGIDLTGAIGAMVMKVRSCQIYILVNDNFAARYNLPRVASCLLRTFEVGCYKLFSSACIFPDLSRFKLLGSPRLSKIFYIPNVLKTSNFSRYKGSESEKLVVLLCGWLVETRGVQLLPSLIDLTDENVEFVLMGFYNEDLKNTVSKYRRVKLLDSVTREKCLEFMANVDLTFAFYNPLIPINRVALPQKVYDSVLVGCPIFVNSEIEMTESLMQTGGCLKSRYFDTADIAYQLNELVSDKALLLSMGANLWSSEYRRKTIDYQTVKDKGIKMYEELAGNEAQT